MRFLRSLFGFIVEFCKLWYWTYRYFAETKNLALTRLKYDRDHEAEVEKARQATN